EPSEDDDSTLPPVGRYNAPPPQTPVRSSPTETNAQPLTAADEGAAAVSRSRVGAVAVDETHTSHDWTLSRALDQFAASVRGGLSVLLLGLALLAGAIAYRVHRVRARRSVRTVS
ncbi:MAG: hypothetical protein ABW321_07645, partial [Polyangiales bacterium]